VLTERQREVLTKLYDRTRAVLGRKRQRVQDNGRWWNDWYSPDGKWMLAQGHSAKSDQWDLFAKKDGKWRWVREVPGLRETIQALARVARRSSNGSNST
jgi:hypothetical protein